MNHWRQRFSPWAAGLVLAVCGWLAVTLPAAERLVILHTTDVHAHSLAWARLATLIRAERKAAGPDQVLLIDTGDTGQGTLVGALTRGAIGVTALNLLEYDVWVPGNHEFDFGGGRFGELVRTCRPAVLAANLAGPDWPAGSAGWRLFERAGHRIAVIGMTSPHLDRWFMPGDLDGLQALPSRASLERVLPEVMAARPDLVVLAIHHGRYTPSRLGEDFLYEAVRDHPQLQLVLVGHSHQEEPGVEFGRHGWLVQPGQHGEFLARIEVVWPDRPGASPQISSRLLPTATTPVASDLATALRQAAAAPAPLSPPPFARLPEGWTPAEFMGHLGQAMCTAAAAEFAVLQPIPGEAVPGPGWFSEAALFRVMPYENRLWRMAVTAAELAEIAAELRAQPEAGYALADGAGHPCSALTLPPPAERRLTVVVSNYVLAGGGGRFPVLRRLGADPATQARSTGTMLRDAIRDHFHRNFPAADGPVLGR